MKHKNIHRAIITVTIEQEHAIYNKDFKSVQELATYLKKEPELAQQLGYIKKGSE